MKKKSRPIKDNEIIDDEDNPEWTAKDFKNALPFDKLPLSLQKKLKGIQKRGRPKKANKAKPVTIRLNPEVERALRAKGRGWQTRLNQALLEMLAEHRL